jgi:hypothetical protein
MAEASPSAVEAAADPAPGDNPAYPYLLAAQTFSRLSPEQAGRVTAFGCTEALSGGTVLFSRGDRAVDFFLVLESAIEMYDNGPDGAPRVFTVHVEQQSTGELDLFNSHEILVGVRVAEGGDRVVRLRRPQFRRSVTSRARQHECSPCRAQAGRRHCSTKRLLPLHLAWRRSAGLECLGSRFGSLLRIPYCSDGI